MKKLTDNQNFSVFISEDEMTAWLRFDTDEPICVGDLQERLTDAGITHGLDHFLLSDLADAHQPEKLYCIACGTPPEDGLKYHFQTLLAPRPRRLSDGRVDLYHTQTVHDVVKQQVLVSKIPQAERRQGFTVMCKPILPPQVECHLPQAGANVALQEEQNALVSLADGYPILRDHILSVEPIYTIEGDVDASVGNLDLCGPIAVSGDVKNGFRIRSTQSVTVYGVVDGGSIDAKSKILLYSNVFGKNHSHIVSDASIEGVYLDATWVKTGNDIILDLGARHCVLQAGGSVLVRGQSAHIIGGHVTARGQVMTHNLGSEHVVPTLVEILPGVYDASESREYLNSIEKVIDDDGRFVEQSLDWELPAEQIEMIIRDLKHCRHAITCLRTYLAKRANVLPVRPIQIGTITVTGTIYPGVVIKIGNKSLEIKRSMTNVLFYTDDTDVNVKHLDD